MKKVILFCLYSFGLNACPIEFNLCKGESCIVFFQEDGKDDSITPIRQYSYTNPAFGEKDTCFTLDFNKENEELRLYIQLRKIMYQLSGRLAK